MKKYEIKLSEKVTEIVKKFLNEGYVFRNSDISHEFTIKVELINPSIPNEFVRVWVKTEYVYYEEENDEMFLYLIKNVLKAGVFNEESTFKENRLLLKKAYYTDELNENIFIEDINEAKRVSNLKKERAKRRAYSFYKKTFKPTRKLNIPGFKTVDPQYVKITRRSSINDCRKDEYIVENIKSGKSTIVSY